MEKETIIMNCKKRYASNQLYHCLHALEKEASQNQLILE